MEGKRGEENEALHCVTLMLHWEGEVERQLNGDVTLGAGRPFFVPFRGVFRSFFGYGERMKGG